MREPFTNSNLKSVIGHISDMFTLPVQRFITETTLLRESLRAAAMFLSDFSGFSGKRNVPPEA